MAFHRFSLHHVLLCSCFMWITFRHVKGNASYMNSDIGAVGFNTEQLDLVTGVTQVSVCDTMTKFIAQINEPPTQFYYKFVDTTGDGNKDSYIYVSVPDAENELGFSLFELDEGDCQMDNPKVLIAAQMGYFYAFSGGYGNPEVNDPSDIPPPIYFNKQGFLVSYYMVMKTFDLTVIEYNKNLFQLCVTRYNQSEDIATHSTAKPLVFNYTVNLDLSLLDVDDENKENLPRDTQDIIDNFGPGMFSIDQLFMDLNTAELLEGLPTIPGMDEYSDTATLLTSFMKIYIENMDPDGNGVLFGYTVTANEDPKYEPSIIPTDLNFYIQPYLNDDLNPTNNYDLFTLNYWMTSEDNTLPQPSRFRWNWIDQSEKDTFDGVMTVRRGLLAQRLADQLNSDLTNNLCYNVYADLVSCEQYKATFRSGVSPCVPQSYTVLDRADTSGNGLALLFRNHAADSWVCDTYSPGIYAYQDITIDTSSYVYFKGGSVHIVSETDVYFALSCEANSKGTSGHFAHYKSEAYYDLSVADEAGKITTTLRGGKVVTEDLSDPVVIDPGYCTVESVTKAVNSIVDNIGTLEGLMDSYASSINDVLNGQLDFVFPGGNTFKFKDVTFSDNGDMMSHITYIGLPS